MADDSSTSSPLSLQSSDEFDVDEEQTVHEIAMPPAKRQRVGNSSRESVARSATPPKLHEDVSISSDSEGEVPNSPGNMRPDDDDAHEQVTVCLWTGCNAGDMRNMDELVKHIHNEHVETRAKKYTCEWSDCSRRSSTHASAYALRAHMRSHTKEKPFFCELPECDRAFTRSDALQKHYRTVHETEALRPSDPIPKSMQAKQASTISTNNTISDEAPQFGGSLPPPLNGISTANEMGDWTTSFPPELGITEEEETIGVKELHRLLRRQILWAEEELDSLKQSCVSLEELRRKEWVDKEILLDQVITIEQDWHERRKLVLAGSADIPAPEIKAALDRSWNQAYATYSPHSRVPYSPSVTSGKGLPVEDQREAAAVLASMAQA